jgi:hypothetical protein
MKWGVLFELKWDYHREINNYQLKRIRDKKNTRPQNASFNREPNSVTISKLLQDSFTYQHQQTENAGYEYQAGRNCHCKTFLWPENFTYQQTENASYEWEAERQTFDHYDTYLLEEKDLARIRKRG